MIIGILYFAEAINSFFQSQIADRVLLLVFILVDLVAVFVPWIEARITDTRERNKRLTEECIAKLELTPSADDEHILTISTSSHEGYTNLSEQAGIKPPYFEEMKAHLQNYPKLWKLVQELPKLYRDTKHAYETQANGIKEELKTVSTAKKLTFPYQPMDDVLSTVTDHVSRDFMRSAQDAVEGLHSTLGDHKVKYDEIDHEASIDGCRIRVPLQTAKILAKKMTEIARNTSLKDNFQSIWNDFERVRQKTMEFPKERDAIVEEIRLSNYKNLKGIPWYKRLDC